MATSKRPQRRAAAQSRKIIELSDSEEEHQETPAKRARINGTSNSKLDHDIAYLTPKKVVQKKQKDTTKQKRSGDKEIKKIVRPSKPVKRKAKTVTEIDDAPEQTVHSSPENPDKSDKDNLISTIDNECEDSPRPTGRSSFWGRRKVWNVFELLAETEQIDNSSARNIVQLFENENTIPFICRYRRDLINHLPPERLRDIKNSYTEIVSLRKRAEHIVTQLEKEEQVNEEVRHEMLCAKTNEELDFLFAPYKPASKGTLAERAKALGLEPYADRLLYGESPMVTLKSAVNRAQPDLDNEDKVSTGICHIIEHKISKHTGVLEELRRLQKVHRVFLKSTKTKASATTKEKDVKQESMKHHHGNRNDQSKYELYFDFQTDVRSLKPHQILAINRGEKSKFLTVKIIINDYLKSDIKRFIWGIFLNEGLRYELRQQIFEKAFEDCFSKKLQPLLTRQIRSDLNECAKKAAIDVFAKNLKQLLLMSPLKGERILGIDPGFTNGCKLALISETADVLETGVIYPHTRQNNAEECGYKLQKMLSRHNCFIIALGNGTACRETEFWLTKMFDLGILDAKTVRYSIVSEQGASIYSCSEVANKEFPNMDRNEISAVSIARRLNDPLSEYVKIEPRHIGVGMYQHDVQDKMLNESLNEVVSECVSYVGVDINTASLSVLKHVAGLTEKKAEKIIQYRLSHGPFKTRKDLMEVKTIGEKTFVQCAGFIRIEPRSVGGQIENLLDCTWVHPESYTIAKKLISKCDLKLKDIGSTSFIAAVKVYAQRVDVNDLADDFKIPKERLEIVFEALQRELFRDYRSDINKRPLFKQSITRLTELSEGDVVTGVVTNITHFGAFVDIGVECDGLIHTSKMNNIQLSLGDRVTASIVQVDVKRKRIGLKIEDTLLETDTSFTFA